MCADGFERQITADVGAGSDDELVVGEGALCSIVLGNFDSTLLQIKALSFSRDELEVLGRVMGKARLYGKEQLLVGNGAGDDTADGGNVPVEV